MSDISNNIDSQSPEVSSAFFSQIVLDLSNSDTILVLRLILKIGRKDYREFQNNIVNIHVYELIVNYFRKILK